MNRMVDLISAVKRETALPDDRFLGVGIAIPSLVSPDGETTVYGMSSNFTGVTRRFSFGIHPLSCENVPRLRNGRFRRNLAYNRPRQYDLFEDAICNVAVLESCAGGGLSRFLNNSPLKKKI